jgi:hypothetical protein
MAKVTQITGLVPSRPGVRAESWRPDKAERALR